MSTAAQTPAFTLETAPARSPTYLAGLCVAILCAALLSFILPDEVSTAGRLSYAGAGLIVAGCIAVLLDRALWAGRLVPYTPVQEGFCVISLSGAANIRRHQPIPVTIKIMPAAIAPNMADTPNTAFRCARRYLSRLSLKPLVC